MIFYIFFQDLALDGDTVRVIWAFHAEDPTSETDLSYHGDNRGTKSLILFGTPPKEMEMTSDVKAWDTVSTGYAMESGLNTAYFCQVFKVPEEAHAKKHQIIGVKNRLK